MQQRKISMQLNFKTFGEGFPLIILHGLMGSLDNWQSIAKKLAEHFKVYIIDQRNHGRSQHSTEMSYAILSADLLDFMHQQQIERAHLIGHSMGGKTVMQFALLHPEMVSKLVVVDITPAAIEDKHSAVFQALFKVDLATITDRRQAEEILRKGLDGDETTVQFLMKSLTRTDDGAGFTWRFNLPVLYQHYPEISAAIESSVPFMGHSLFIKGAKSGYITATTYEKVIDLFPNNELLEIADAGHWVHAEKPVEFTDGVLKFLRAV